MSQTVQAYPVEPEAVHVTHPDMADIHPEKDKEQPKVFYSASTNTREYQLTQQGTLTTQNLNPGKISFQTTFSEDIVLDRTVLVQYTLEATVTGAAVGAAKTLANTSGLCLASYPLQRCVSDTNVKLNNNSSSVNPWEWLSAYNWSHDGVKFRRMGAFPSQPDNYNSMAAMEYSGATQILRTDGTHDNAAIVQTAAASDSPFAGRNGAGYTQPRNVFPPSSVVHRDPTAGVEARLTVKWTITEPVLHPFFVNNESKKSLARISYLGVDMNINNLNAAFTIGPNLLKNYNNNAAVAPAGLVLQDAVAGIVGFAADSQARLLLRTYVPTTSPLPVVTIPYNDIVVRRENIDGCTTATAADTSKGTCNTRSITLSQVPHKIMIFGRPRQQVTANNHTDAFLRIDSLTIQTDRDQGGLNSASPAQLHQMSVRNGLNMPYNKFARDVGSVVILDLTRGDVAGVVPGIRAPFTFNINANFTNTQYNTPIPGSSSYFAAGVAQNAQWDMYVVCFMDARMVLDGTTCTLISGENEELVRQTVALAPMHMDSERSDFIVHAGGFWKDFSRGFKKGWRGTLDAAKAITEPLKIGRDLAGVMGGNVRAGNVRAGGIRTLG